jgi:hypothetical protein
VATYCFVPPFRKAIFCGVPSRAIVKAGGAVGKRRYRNTVLFITNYYNSYLVCNLYLIL